MRILKALCIVLIPASAAAQDRTFPRVHFGAQVTAIELADAAGLRFEFRRNERESLEIAVDRRHHVPADQAAPRRERIRYSLSYKWRFSSASRTKGFLTIGGQGHYTPVDSRPGIFTMPFLPVVGTGLERSFGSFGLHADIQFAATGDLVPWVPFVELTAQTHVGVFIPFGRRASRQQFVYTSSRSSWSPRSSDLPAK